ncbi:hypothetical protein L1987_70685 [Smallanthus sonchifolius]|uniref:Uncharacterized protein n=1 Tax=Smallanthus sonchifolius TaxID=185202 RepID=A0ACB9ARP2_9ASTR|nr:hypothetical protein L1987_70685 [Smallanthus sonchifolius]
MGAGHNHLHHIVGNVLKKSKTESVTSWNEKQEEYSHDNNKLIKEKIDCAKEENSNNGRSTTLQTNVPNLLNGSAGNLVTPESVQKQEFKMSGCDKSSHSSSKKNSQLISNTCTVALAAENYYYFIWLMGRRSSFIDMECTLQSYLNIVVLVEEVVVSQLTIFDKTKKICDFVQTGVEQDKNRGVISVKIGGSSSGSTKTGIDLAHALIVVMEYRHGIMILRPALTIGGAYGAYPLLARNHVIIDALSKWLQYTWFSDRVVALASMWTIQHQQLMSVRKRVVIQVLSEWKDHPPDDAIWEYIDELQLGVMDFWIGLHLYNANGHIKLSNGFDFEGIPGSNQLLGVLFATK